MYQFNGLHCYRTMYPAPGNGSDCDSDFKSPVPCLDFVNKIVNVCIRSAYRVSKQQGHLPLNKAYTNDMGFALLYTE